MLILETSCSSDDGCRCLLCCWCYHCRHRDWLITHAAQRYRAIRFGVILFIFGNGSGWFDSKVFSLFALIWRLFEPRCVCAVLCVYIDRSHSCFFFHFIDMLGVSHNFHAYSYASKRAKTEPKRVHRFWKWKLTPPLYNGMDFNFTLVYCGHLTQSTTFFTHHKIKDVSDELIAYLFGLESVWSLAKNKRWFLNLACHSPREKQSNTSKSDATSAAATAAAAAADHQSKCDRLEHRTEHFGGMQRRNTCARALMCA